MSGHSKWANTKHRKSAQDGRRANLASKLIREITVAVKASGPKPEDNPALRSLIDRAFASNLKRRTIDNAIQRAAGSEEGSNGERLVYEGYGPGGIAILVECMTDNRNRSVAQVRHAFAKSGCSLGASGSVAYLFERQGEVRFENVSEDALLILFSETGVIDVHIDEDEGSVVTTTEALTAVASKMGALGLTVVDAQVVYSAKIQVTLNDGERLSAQRLMEQLESLDDTQSLYQNGKEM